LAELNFLFSCSFETQSTNKLLSVYIILSLVFKGICAFFFFSFFFHAIHVMVLLCALDGAWSPRQTPARMSQVRRTRSFALGRRACLLCRQTRTLKRRNYNTGLFSHMLLLLRFFVPCVCVLLGITVFFWHILISNLFFLFSFSCAFIADS